MKQPRISIGLSLITMLTLMLEIVLTRAFDVILTPNMAYMIITLAMFSFGLAGVFSSLYPNYINNVETSHLSLISFCLAISLLTILPALNLLPFNYREIFESPLLQVISFTGMFLFLAAPFFLAGLFISTIFASYARNIQSIYFWDLTGAAVGCVIFIPLMPIIGPGGLLFCCAAVSLIVSAIFSAPCSFIQSSTPFSSKTLYTAYMAKSTIPKR